MGNAVEKKPGQVTVAVMDLGQAVASLEDRINLLGERLRPIRFNEPRPVDPGMKGDGQMQEQADLATELLGQTDRLRRIESVVTTLIAELQI